MFLRIAASSVPIMSDEGLMLIYSVENIEINSLDVDSSLKDNVK